MAVAFGCLCAYLLGGVPFALLLVRLLKGIDVRSVGSGNVGATNASRAFSSRGGRILAFLAIYLLDAAKGFAPACWGPGLVGAEGSLLAAALLGSSAVLGHVFTPYLHFRGGKGVATTCGALLALDWQALLLALLVFFLVRLWSGTVFLGSIALGLSLAVAAIVLHPATAFGERLPVTVLCLLAAAFLVWTHRSNLRKRLAGTSGAAP